MSSDTTNTHPTTMPAREKSLAGIFYAAVMVCYMASLNPMP